MSPCRRIVLAAIALLAAAPAWAADGLLDVTFSTDGLLLVSWSAGSQPAQAQAVASFADGSLLVAGEVDVSSSNPDLGFVKIGADGFLDIAWGALGRRIVPIDAETGGDDSVRALAALRTDPDRRWLYAVLLSRRKVSLLPAGTRAPR